MKDGRTHLAHKAEHAVDMETGAMVAVTLQPANAGDTSTVHETLIEAVEHVQMVAEVVNPESETAVVKSEGPIELVTDKGYHSREVVRDLSEAGVRTYISEPERGPQKWIGQKAEQAAVYGNRHRVRGARGKRLQRQRGEKLERVNAHLYETGGMRRTHLRGHPNILKRLLIHAGALNLGIVLRAVCRIGTPRGLQDGVPRPLQEAQIVLFWLLCLLLNAEETKMSQTAQTCNSGLGGNAFSPTPGLFSLRCRRRNSVTSTSGC